MDAGKDERSEMSLEEHLAVPYVMSMESRQDADGNWIRHAAYPELPGVEAEGETPIEAIDRLDEAREDYIREKLEHGEEVPVPRESLRQETGGVDT